MARWAWFLPVGVLVVGVALVGLRYGIHAARLTETDVINGYAERHVAHYGGTLADCHAEAGNTLGVWIVVHCFAGTGAEPRSYHVNRMGWLTREVAGAATSGPVPAPET